MHLFNENLRSEYLDHPDTLPVFHYETLPLVDGCLWSTEAKMAGLRLEAPAFTGGAPAFVSKDGTQTVSWPSADGKGRFELTFTESAIEVASRGKTGDWYLELTVAPGAALPFTEIGRNTVRARYQEMDYGFTLQRGRAEDLRSANGEAVLRLLPEGGKLDIKF